MEDDTILHPSSEKLCPRFACRGIWRDKPGPGMGAFGFVQEPILLGNPMTIFVVNSVFIKDIRRAAEGIV